MLENSLMNSEMHSLKVLPRVDRPHSRNVIPAAWSNSVASFIYLDHLGPHQFPAGHELFIPPHPHAGIATISFLFEGEGHHQDSLGNNQVLHARRLNYMNAGNGILHSEGLSAAFSQKGGRLCGIQLWHLLSQAEGEAPPFFQSIAEHELPKINFGADFFGVLLLGNYAAKQALVLTDRSLQLMTIETESGGNATIQLQDDWEYLIYLCDGTIQVNDQWLGLGEGLVFTKTSEIRLLATKMCRAIILGGPKLEDEFFFNGSLVALNEAQMATYMSRIRQNKIGTMASQNKSF